MTDSYPAAVNDEAVAAEDDREDAEATFSQDQVASQALLPSVVHDYPVTVLLVDTASAEVAFVNDLARQLAPDVQLEET